MYDSENFLSNIFSYGEYPVISSSLLIKFWFLIPFWVRRQYQWQIRFYNGESFLHCYEGEYYKV